jgi:putative oxidoreductase
MSFGKLAARTVIGGLFLGHGLQKFTGSIGGSGLDATEQAAALTESVGGAMLALGLATPLASAGLIGTVITAIRKVHLANGPWAVNGGWEYNGVLIAALVAVAEAGPGQSLLTT